MVIPSHGYLRVFMALTTVCAFVFGGIINSQNNIKIKDNGFEVVEENSYLIINFIRINRHQAELLCKKIGGDLATFNTRNEETLLLNHLKETRRDPLSNGGGLWISLSNQNDDNVWYWTANGTQLTYDDGWAPGQPDLKNQTCGTLQNIGFDNDHCGSLRGFICQK